MFSIGLNFVKKKNILSVMSQDKTTDKTFFTNDKNGTLLDRFKKTLQHVENFDVLVGYFRTSGF